MQNLMLEGWADFEEHCYREEISEFSPKRNDEDEFERFYARRTIRRAIAAIRLLRAEAGADALVNP